MKETWEERLSKIMSSLHDNPEYNKCKEKLIYIRSESKKALENLRDAEKQLEDVQSEYDRIENEFKNIELQKRELEEQIRDLEIEEFLGSKNYTGDIFVDSLIKAAWFCVHDEDGIRPLLENIQIGDNAIIACDSIQAIEISCGNIPEEFKNKYIHWKNTSPPKVNPKSYNMPYPDLYEKVFNISDYQKSKKVFIPELREQWLDESQERPFEDSTYINIGDVEYLFNTNLLINAMHVLADKNDVILLYSDKKDPVMIVADDIKVVIMPSRYKKPLKLHGSRSTT